MGIAHKLASASALFFIVSMTACGGGGGDPSAAPPPPAPAAPPVLTLSSDTPTGQVVEGGTAVTLTLTGAAATNGTIAWALSPAVGALSNTSTTGATYVPPAIGVISQTTMVIITATPVAGAAPAAMFTITLAPFGVASASPGAGTAVDVSVQPAIQFTRAPAPSTLVEPSLSITSPVANVPVDVTANGSTATLRPRHGLVWGAHYTVSLSSGIISAVGQSLAPTSFSFDVAAPSWTSPQQVVSPVRTTGTPRVAWADRGRAFAVWQHDSDGFGTWNIQAARFDLTNRTWSAAVALSPGSRSQYSPVLAASGTGWAVAVWTENTGSLYAAMAAIYNPIQAAWGPATQIQTVPSGNALAPEVVMDADGNATAVWSQYTGSIPAQAVYGARFSVASDSWQAAEPLDPGSGDSRNPRVALDAAGNVVVVWERWSGLVSQVTAARRPAATGAWTAPQLVQTSALSGGGARLVITAGGDPTVAWIQSVAGGSQVVAAARWIASPDTWLAPRTISLPGAVTEPQVQVDHGGNVTVVWAQSRGGSAFGIDAARYDPVGGTWAAPVALDTATSAFGPNPYPWGASLTVDAAGMATATWTRDVGNSVFHAYRARYDSHLRAWSAPVSLGTPGAIAERVHLAADTNGNVLATWGERDQYFFQVPWSAVLTGP